jgi:HEPN domain-containing protein
MCSPSRDTITAGDDFVRIEQVCFHALQALEKAIKALLL